MQKPSPSTGARQWSKDVPKMLERSPFYRSLYARIVQDQEIAAFQALIAEDEPFHVLFFALINYLLFREEGQWHPFAEFHPYLTSNPRPVEEAYPFFRDFCLLHADELRRLLPDIRLQTNEVTRCANLLPAFELVYQRGGQRPLALIEIGTSAGFNLYWDRYAYLYETADHNPYRRGDAASPVLIHCSLQSEHLPPLPTAMPVIASRIGLDLKPLDCQNVQEMHWLRACIWPEERWRYQLLDTVLAVVKKDPPRVLAGDAYDLLPDLLAAISAEYTICLYHSYALLHDSSAMRDRIFDLLTTHSRVHDLYRISLEWDHVSRWPIPRLELFTYQGGELTRQEWLANCDRHGRTMNWLGADE